LVTIPEIEYEDIDKGVLDVLNNLVPTNIDDKEHAKNILQKVKIKSNSLHTKPLI
jgi:hypothetical protein